MVVAVASMAPTAGDIGGCGQPAEALDPEKFFLFKASIDCQQCRDCGLLTERCDAACAAEPDADAFAEGCRPVAHDGEVCLNALRAASCDAYASYVSDVAPTAPSECNFCPQARP